MATSLEGNKIIAGLLCAGLLAMATGKIAGGLVHPEMLEENAYKIEVSETAVAAVEPEAPAPIEPILGMLASADVAAGEKASKQCAACHSFDDGGRNGVGPNLWAMVNADKAAVDGYNYSSALAEFSDPATWTYSSLNAFLYNPKEYVPGTKMGFRGVKKAEDRANIIAYMRAQASSPAALPTEAEIQAAEEAFQAASGG
jgi:cytochrome c